MTAHFLKPSSTPTQATAWPEYEATISDVASPENRFLVHAKGGANMFLTGQAGTGKSTLLRQFISESEQPVSITAPTGIAALNIGGMTIHRFCGMLLGPRGSQTDEQYFEWLRAQPYYSIPAGFRRVKNAQCVVIDEISMMPGRQLDFVNYLFRRLRGSERPFGGCQIIATGDFLQLPPVRTNESEPYDWAFQSQSWEEAGFITIGLEKVRRQDEQAFVQALSAFRVGSVSGESAKILRDRVKMFPKSDVTRLYTHNVQVDKWNDFQLGELPGNAVDFNMDKYGDQNLCDFLTKNLLTPARLSVKPGARVMFTVNHRSREHGYEFVNGQTGVVESIDSDTLHIMVASGDVYPVKQYSWIYNNEDPSQASVRQFPVRLAYALTIHKTQGITMDAAHIDIRAAREPGQAYVAMSRVKTLAGLSLKEWPKGVFVSTSAVEFYEQN